MKKHTEAFTMVELVFVIVVIGILSAVAIPKLAATRDDAEITRARTVLASVRNAIATERQRRILEGNFTKIGDLGDETYAFNRFDSEYGREVLLYPIKNCTKNQTNCWKRTEKNTYLYYFPSADQAQFVLQYNKLECKNDNCTQLTD